MQTHDNFLDQEQCSELISTLENSGHCEDEREIGDDLFARYDFIDFKLRDLVEQRLNSIGYKCKVLKKWYMSKYWPLTGNISSHIDGSYLGSTHTILIYLNTTDGGETVLELSPPVAISPVVGRLVLLEQSVFHHTKYVNSGFKYILRGDLVMQDSIEKNI